MDGKARAKAASCRKEVGRRAGERGKKEPGKRTTAVALTYDPKISKTPMRTYGHCTHVHIVS